MSDHLIVPHGGKLVNLVADPEHAKELRRSSRNWVSWTLTERQRCELELLLSGAYSPLRGFMARKDYESVCGRMRLYSDVLWPVPVVLDVSDTFAETLETGQPMALRDAGGELLAYIDVEEKWKPDRTAEADLVYGTTDPQHPGVHALLEATGPWYVGGRVVGIEIPGHDDFQILRHTPQELRRNFQRLGWQKVAGFHTTAQLHRAQYEQTRRAMRDLEACLLLQPAVGTAGADDLEHFSRVRCWQSALAHYPAGTATLSLLPLVERRAGPKEALLHAIIRRNCGCSHFIVGPDHAGAGRNRNGIPYYQEYEAQELALQHAADLGITPIPARRMLFVEELETWQPADEVPTVRRGLELSEAEALRRLSEGRGLPRWYTFPEVEAELARLHPPRDRQGFTVFFTGLPASGKSTLARTLRVRLQEAGGRAVSCLDGESIDSLLAAEPGAQNGDRDVALRRLAYVAAQVTRDGGVAICAPVAPHESSRQEARRQVAAHGGFLLVHVATPLAICEARDRRGVYEQARAGRIQSLPGVSEPFEPPQDADMVLDMSDLTPQEAVQRIILRLQKEGYLAAE